MKRYLFIGCTLISLNVIGQTYHPMLDSLTWVTQYFNFTGTWSTWYYSHGDTTISGNNYKIYYNGAYLREDTINRKVYRWSTTSQVDYILYDFNLGFGDTLQMSHGPAVVTGIDSLLTYSGYRTRWYLLWHDPLGNPFTQIVVESIGSLVDPIDNICPPNYDPQWYTSCFYHHGIKTYGSSCPNHLTNFQMFINPSTCGQCNGSISIFATFIPDTLWWMPEYSWTPHGPIVIGNLCPLSTGTVIVTQTSTNFQYMDWYMIPDNPAPDIQNTNTTPVSCSNCCDGSILETVSSGVPPYTYSWSPNVSTTNTASGLCPGTYIISVTDSTGCTASDTVSISFTTSVSNYHIPIFIIPTLLTGGELLKINALPLGTRLAIFDLQGRQIFWSESYQDNFSSSTIASGTYILLLSLPDGRLQKQKLCIIH
jgi:hypothetical protein